MKNRKALLTIGALVLTIVVTTFMGIQLERAKHRLASARTTLATIDENKDAFITMSQNVAALERKRNITRVEGLAQAVEEVLDPLGMKDKLTSLKPVPSSNPGEDSAEVVLQSIDLNEMANIMYAVKSAPMLLITKKADISTSFLHPGLVDLTLTLTFIKPETKKQ